MKQLSVDIIIKCYLKLMWQCIGSFHENPSSQKAEPKNELGEGFLRFFFFNFRQTIFVFIIKSLRHHQFPNGQTKLSAKWGRKKFFETHTFYLVCRYRNSLLPSKKWERENTWQEKKKKIPFQNHNSYKLQNHFTWNTNKIYL